MKFQFLKNNPFKKRSETYVIDEIFPLIPRNDPFELEPLLRKSLSNRAKVSDLAFYTGLDLLETTMINEGFIEKLPDGKFKLSNPRGFLAKELGGYSNFKKYRSQEINSLAHQRRINYWLIVVALIGAASAPITEIVKGKFFEVPTKSQPQTINFKIDSSFLNSDPRHLKDTLNVHFDKEHSHQKNNR